MYSTGHTEDRTVIEERTSKVQKKSKTGTFTVKKT